MKNTQKIIILGLLAAFCAFGQINTITVTTTSAAQTTSNPRQLSVTSATGIVAQSGSTPASQLYVVEPGQTEG